MKHPTVAARIARWPWQRCQWRRAADGRRCCLTRDHQPLRHAVAAGFDLYWIDGEEAP